jgi:translocation and assembly module TamA
VLATRLRLGTILGGEIPDVPASRRFYAGGGGSVRGYEFQAIGPRAPDNNRPFGGLSLVETSVELRRSNIWKRLAASSSSTPAPWGRRSFRPRTS